MGACYAVARVNTKRVSSLLAALTAAVLLAACTVYEEVRPVVVQGAMDVEIRKLPPPNAHSLVLGIKP